MILRCSLVLVVIRVFDTFSFSLTYKFHVVHGRYEVSLMHEDLQRLFAGEMKDHGAKGRRTSCMEIHVSPCVLRRRAAKQKMQHTTIGMSFSRAEKKNKITAAIKCWNGCLQSKKTRDGEPSSCEKGGATQWCVGKLPLLIRADRNRTHNVYEELSSCQIHCPGKKRHQNNFDFRTSVFAEKYLL